MCDSIGIEPKPNNGTFRLPLKPIGLHSEEHTSTEDDLPGLPAETSHIDDSPTEANEPELADSPVEPNVQSDGTSTSNTKPADPVDTDVLNDPALPEGTPQMKQVDIVF